MSILSSNNSGIQESIKQWWIGVKEKNTTHITDSSRISVLRNGNGYIIVDRVWQSTSIKISDCDWNSRSPLLKNIFCSSIFGSELTPINIDIMCNDHQTVVDLSNITTSIDDKTGMYMTAKSRQKIFIVCNCDDSIRIFGLHSDNIDLEIADLKTPKHKNIQNITGDINIKIDSNDSWHHCLRDVKTTGFVRFDMMGTCDIWEFIQTNKKKDRWGFVLNQKYLNDIDELYKHNNGRMLFKREIPPDKDISYDWWQPAKVTYEVSKCRRYGYRLIDIN